jgi:hypothetical protein
MVRTNSFLAIAVTAALVAAQANAAELQRSTAEAWQVYVRGAGTRMHARTEGSKPFLWMEETADRARRVKRGEIIVAPLVGRGTQSVPNGLIHDWIGAVNRRISWAVVPSVLEIAYALVYALPTFALVVLYLYGRREMADRFLTAVLPSALLCYARFPFWKPEQPQIFFAGMDPRFRRHSVFGLRLAMTADKRIYP